MSEQASGYQSEGKGQDDLLNRLFDQIYDELYSMAQNQRARWRGMDTLNTTALLHETYLKLKKHNPARIESRRHFMGLASKAMRHVLINYAEKRLAQKRGSGNQVVPVDDVNLIADDHTAAELINLHQALEKLEKQNDRLGRVVECRFFGGMTVADTAFSLNVSEATVKRDWQAACDWLYAELGNDNSGRYRG
jgi:RNA polymerase sigma factor (TIGR02999 family)